MEQKELIKTKDGREMEIGIFQPEAENNSVIVIGQGILMQQSSYNGIANFLTGNGYTIITFSYRGLDDINWLRNNRSYTGLKHWAMQDLDAVLLFVKHRFQKKELVFLAHGISGEIVGIAPASSYINRMVMISSALTCARLRPWPIRFQLFIKKKILAVILLFFHYYPGKKIGYLSDMPKGVMKEWVGWCDNENGLFDEFPDNNYCRLRIPILSISFTRNPFIPDKAIHALLSRYSNAQIRKMHLPDTVLADSPNDENAFFYKASSGFLWNIVSGWLESEESYNGYFNQAGK